MRPRNSLLFVLFLVLILTVVIAFFILVVQQDRSAQQPGGDAGSSAPTPNQIRPSPEHANESRVEPERVPTQGQSCTTLGVVCASKYFQTWQEPSEGSCHTSMRSGFPVPDPQCTPGGINTSVTLSVMQDAGWRTRCIRDCAESQARKHAAYIWYQIPNPQHNSGSNQFCELDHLVPLELGGADGMGNIWPQCGPDDVDLSNRYFKVKDRVENYLADEVKAGRMPLDAAQQGIASDWTQYVDEANRYCANGGRC